MLEVLTSVVITILKIPNMSVPNMYGLLDIVYIQIMCSFRWMFSFWLDFFFFFFFAWIRHHMNLKFYIYTM